MNDSGVARREALARRYRLEEQAEWHKLLDHFDLAEGFDFVVLLVPDADGATLCREELEKHLESTGHSLRAVEVDSPDALRRLPEHFLDEPCDEKTACLWLAAIAPDYAPDYAAWRAAWEHALSRLNAFRNPIRERFCCTLLFVGAPWLQVALRETAPDLWSVRTIVVTIETAAHPTETRSGPPSHLPPPTFDGPDPHFALQQAAKLRGVPGRELELATLLHRAGQGFQAQSNWREAEKNYSASLELQQQHNAPPTALISTLHKLAWACIMTGQARRALELAEQSLPLAREMGDILREGASLGYLGLAYADLGEMRRAIEYYEQQLAVAREIGDRHGEGSALGNLGLTYADLGETRLAIEYHEKALIISREIGDRRAEGQDLGNLGNAYADLGETRRAIEYYEQQLAVAREIGDRHGEGTALGNLGNAYADLGETRLAIEFFEKVLIVSREIGDRRGQGNASFNMAVALVSLGETEQVIELAQAALTIFEAIEDPHAPMVRAALAAWRGEAEPEGAAE